MKKLNKKRLALLTACVISSIANMGFAAEAENIDEYEGADYVVTATRTQLEKKEVPVAVEVITEQKIKDLGAYSVQDALRLAANVDVQDAGMTGNVVQIRGNSTKYTLILINGKRMASENSDSAINVYELKRINIADVERIEVLRGNSSALYGSDAVGGVINVITKKPVDASMTVNMHTGSKDEGTAFTYASGKQGKISMKIGGAIEKVRKIDTGLYNNYTVSNGSVNRQSDASSSNMYGTRRHLNTEFTYDFDDAHSLDLDMNFMREQLKTSGYDNNGSDYKNGYSMMGMQMPIRYEMSKLYNYDNNRSDYALSFNGKDGKHDYNFRTYYSQLRKENHTNYTKLGDGTTHTNLPTGTTSLIDFDKNNYKTFVIEGKDSYKANEKNTLTYGAEYKKNIMDGTLLKDGGSKLTTATYGDISKISSEVKDETVSAYLEDELRVNDKLLVIPAVRIDHHNAYGTHTSPKIGATYNLSDNSRIKVNYGKGFRAPTLFELYAHMEKSGMMPMTVHALGNPNLNPETSTNFDISLEAEKNKVMTKVSYFHNKIKDMIGSDDLVGPAYTNGIWSQYVNFGDVEISGAELEVGYNFDDNWSVKGSYNYLDAKDNETGKRLTSRARHNGLVQLTYTDAKENPLTVNLYNRFYVDYHATNSEGANGSGAFAGQTFKYRQNYTFGLTGLTISKQINKNYRVYAGVDNIFDKKFYYDTFNTYSIDGRTWRVGAEMTF